MENNISFRLKKIIYILFLLSCCLNIFAQEDQDYYLKDTKDGAVFVQRFSWDENPNVLKYEFIIEKLNKRDKWEPLDKIETEIPSVEVSLTAGKYHYKIIVYNYLGLQELETDWYEVDVIKAYQPKINSISPGTVYLEEDPDGRFSVSGSELRPETTIWLQDGKRKLPATIVETSKNNHTVEIQIDKEILDTGKWTVNAKNIGGLTDSFDLLNIQYKKPMDLDISGGYTTFIVPYNSFPKPWFEIAFPAAVYTKVNFLPSKHKKYYQGLSLSCTAAIIHNETDPSYEVNSGLILTSLCYNYQKLFNDKKIFWDFHTGLNLYSFINLHCDYKNTLGWSSPLSTFNFPGVSLGTSVIFYLNKRLFLEGNIDTSCAFYGITLNDIKFNQILFTISPSIGIGYQF